VNVRNIDTSQPVNVMVSLITPNGEQTGTKKTHVEKIIKFIPTLVKDSVMELFENFNNV